jgi:hypothetical protein
LHAGNEAQGRRNTETYCLPNMGLLANKMVACCCGCRVFASKALIEVSPESCQFPSMSKAMLRPKPQSPSIFRDLLIDTSGLAGRGCSLIPFAGAAGRRAIKARTRSRDRASRLRIKSGIPVAGLGQGWRWWRLPASLGAQLASWRQATKFKMQWPDVAGVLGVRCALCQARSRP